MSHHIKRLNKTKNGSFLHCDYCKVYHVLFGHFHFEFTVEELKYFRWFLKNINIDYWEKRYESDLIERKIPIPTLQQNLCLNLNREELNEIKRLLCIGKDIKDTSLVNFKDIDYDFISN